ncbi:MAG: hypothetical protein IT374_22545 [Polyangiaceae bacterium]|nr:hypothetical protein [Polyangiaceae bacterium]
MQPLLRSLAPTLSLLLALPSCASTMSLSTFEGTAGVSWPALRPGSRVLVHAGPSCDLRHGTSLPGALGADKGAPKLEGGTSGVGTVGRALVDPGAKRVAFELTGDGRTDFVSMPFDGAGCLYPPDLPGYAEAKAATGKRFVFAPWKLSCDTVLAVGRSASGILFEGEGAEVTASGVGVFDDSKGVPMPWVTFSAKFAVPMQTFDACFEAVESELAKAPTDLRRLLHLEDKQCASSDYKGKPHLECTSSLGVWQVEIDDVTLKATLRHQTLGTAHFLGPRLMDGEAFAKVVVGLELGQATDERQGAVVLAMTEAVRATLASEAGGARVTTKHDPAATVQVRLSLADLSVGELQTTEERETVTYRDHEEDVPNPKKAERDATADAAEAAVPVAEQALKDAEARFEESKKTRERIADECRDQAKKAGTWGGILGGAACGAATDAAADVLLVSSARSQLQKARADASSARTAANAEPATTRRWVMLPWTYTKKAYRRTVSVNVDLTVAPKGGEPTRANEPLRLDLTDWEVQADARHGVKGHAPDENLLRRPDALADRIASQVSGHVQARLRAVLLAEERRTAADALATAGIEVTREDNVVVDAAAFAAVGSRIVKAERRGTAKVSSSPIVIDGIDLREGECLLAVAAAVAPADAPVVLWAKDRRVIDERARSSAFVELCGPPRPFTLELPRGGTARWAVYRVK